MENQIKKVAELIKKSSYTTAFTGAGISVESGVPAFRGENGIWNKYNPQTLEIDYFYQHPQVAWKAIREIFYEYFGVAQPNAAHLALAEMESKGLLQAIVTQNIDNLHQAAGSKTVYEFHGNAMTMVCTKCGKKYPAKSINLETIPPLCPSCKALLKPDFVFFGEGIPEFAFDKSMEAAEKSQVMLIIGTTGEVYPAALVPQTAKKQGAAIIEINTTESSFTHQTSTIFLQGKAGEIMKLLSEELDKR